MANSITETGKRQWDHYVRLIIRKAWFIIPVSVLFLFVWFFSLTHTGLLKPALSAQSVLRFDDPANLSAVDERVADDPESRLVLIQSRLFMEDVVRKLSLQLQTGKIERKALFDSIVVQSEALNGLYEIKFIEKQNKYVILFSNKSAGIKECEVYAGQIEELDSIRLPGVYLRFSSQYLKSPYPAKFSVCRVRDAVDNILSNLSVRLSEPSGTIMTITLEGRDYGLITEVVNTIAQDFVETNSFTKGSRKKEILAILEKQLKTAEKSMKEAETSLRHFRDENPTVGLPDAMLPPNMLNDLRESEADLRSHVLQARALQERYRSAENNSLLPLINEMIAFLMRHSAPTASGLHAECNRLSVQQRMYDSAYSPNHPHVQENRKRISELGAQVSKALSTLTNDLKRRVQENEDRVNSLHRDLATLPAKEIQYSKLKRQYEVNAEIYAGVLSRYNEALVANSVAATDVYLVDIAVEPESGRDMRSLILVLGAGFFFSMAAGFGPVLVLDYFDRRARTEKDLSRLTHFLLLESIPIKGRWDKRVLSSYKSGIDPKLVAADYSHNFVDETYRSLRAKILLSLFDQKKKRILVTSLNMGEGKSFTAANIAITMAQQELRTVLIDGDLRRAVQHCTFGIEKRPGLSNLLSERIGSVQPQSLDKVLRRTHISNLYLLPSGTPALNSAELINSSRFREALEMLCDRFDVVIMDTPPLAVTTDAVGIQDSFERYIIVAKANFTNITHLNKKIAEFPGLKKKVLGIVFNGAPYRRPEYYQYNSYRY
ncbi:MAG: polysaccharide biosynthesis tyrosine autokinase [Chitinispirillales bacterium]|jgi:tyrosine-protein kinase Etk/Wzc|nr:polysaccharide biosynthesis tyrosine autokinase [Chitinispirillales bacterium]